jgi:hypothetical protein
MFLPPLVVLGEAQVSPFFYFPTGQDVVACCLDLC